MSSASSPTLVSMPASFPATPLSDTVPRPPAHRSNTMPVSIMSSTPPPGTRTPRRVQWASSDHIHLPPSEPASPHALDEMAQDVSSFFILFYSYPYSEIFLHRLIPLIAKRLRNAKRCTRTPPLLQHQLSLRFTSPRRPSPAPSTCPSPYLRHPTVYPYSPNARYISA